jgi:hypothetical protein
LLEPIEPVYAMVVASLYTKNNRFHQSMIPKVKNGDPKSDDWIFDLSKHLTTVIKSNPDCDVYVIGYRDEERPNSFSARFVTCVRKTCWFSKSVVENNLPSRWNPTP